MDCAMVSELKNWKNRCVQGCLGVALAFLAGCMTLDASPVISVDRSAEWVLLPFINATETPLAAQRAEAVTMGLLQSFGVGNIQRYPQSMQDENLFEAGQGKSQEQALAWAQARKARYGLSGTVQEWRYKVGVDGEPAVGVSLQLIDLADGRVVWSALGARSGWSRETLAGVAQKLIKSMLEAGLRKS
jgi:TolB-like protein